jgi:hypothetical protein
LARIVTAEGSGRQAWFGGSSKIDAKSDRARQWYEDFGAMPLLDNPMALVTPLATFEAAE